MKAGRRDGARTTVERLSWFRDRTVGAPFAAALEDSFVNGTSSGGHELQVCNSYNAYAKAESYPDA
jgi:hypothetical protein